MHPTKLVAKPGDYVWDEEAGRKLSDAVLHWQICLNLPLKPTALERVSACT